MVQHKEVPSLKTVSLQSLENGVFETCCNIFEDQFSTYDDLANRSEKLTEFISNEIILCLHDQVAEHILRAVERFLVKTHLRDSSLSDDWVHRKGVAIMKLIVSIVPHLKITVLKMGDWSLPVQSVLIQLLDKMIRLKILDTPCPLNTAEPNPFIAKTLSSLGCLTNLTSFHMPVFCTNEILASISERCSSIRKVGVRASKQVTDSGCEHLQKLEELQEVDLADTAVTSIGYGKLLTESKSRNLFNIGACFFMSDVLDFLENEPARTYQLQHLKCLDLDADHLSLLHKYFPFLNELDIHYTNVTAPDFYRSLGLERLCCIKVRVSAQMPDPVSRFLSIKGEPITCLSLGAVDDLLTSNIVNIAKSCPNLKNLKFFSCSFSDTVDFFSAELMPKPFQKLTEFVWSHNDSLAHAGLVLRYAHNIKVLYFMMDNSLTIDHFFASIFAYNPLNELKEFTTRNMTTYLFKLFTMKCKKISLIGYVFPSRPKEIQEIFNKHNFNLTIK